MAKKEKLLVGVDIGSSAVKACQLQKSGNTYTLVALGSVALPPDSVEDGVLQEPEVVGEAITKLFKNLKFKKNTKVAISISGFSVIVKKIKVDVMKEDELEQYLNAEAEQYIPFDIEDVYLDFQDLKTAKEEYDQTDIMLVAAKKEVVDGYLDMLRDVKLVPLLVDVDGFALENIWTTVEKSAENVALVDIGAEKMNINIIVNGTSVLARDIGVGSSQLTSLIARTFDIDEEEAEQIKIGVIPAGERQAELEELVTQTCTNWVFEIQKAVDLYRSKNADRPLTRIFLSGGGSKVKGLAEFIGKEVGIEVTPFNPFAGMKVNEKKIDRDYIDAIAPQMTIAAGLAIRPSEI
ncbi:MAG: type IV pilus assembly protein PilM [Desulfobulbaceae bacterium]|nr:type IV pilus assembly protein PilM [Desulfobulbaceae bacterium]